MSPLKVGDHRLVNLRWLDIFWNKVDTSGKCWEWTGTILSTGYGRIMNDQKPQFSHRVAWELTHAEEIPDGLFVCHTCDNPACVNPDHLFIGTSQDNQKDMVSKGRQNPPYGERSGSAKLTWKDVGYIRAIYKPGIISQQQLAEQFNISRTIISRIVNGVIWNEN